MHLTENDVLRDMIFEMNGMRVYHVNYPLVEESKKKKKRKRECKLLLSERNIALPCWTVSIDYR